MISKISRKIGLFILAALASSVAAGLSGIAAHDDKTEQSDDSPKPEFDRVDGVGALGQIEPRSRVIRVSHNAGPEGVKLQTLFFEEGDLVKKGDLLALLTDNNKRKAELDAAEAAVTASQARLSAENINLAFNEKEYRRFEKLETTSAVSKSIADQKKLAFEQSKAAINVLQAEIAGNQADRRVAEATLANTRITAPLAGTIIKIHARPGEKINNNGLLEMADLTALDVVAEVYESDIPKVRIGRQAQIRLAGFSKPFAATVRELGFMVKKNDLNDTDPLADKDNRIIEVRLTLEQDAVAELQHQIYRQVQVRILQ